MSTIEELDREIRALQWADEAVQLMHAKHCHPLPMVTLIFAYAETLGRALAAERGLGCKTRKGGWLVYSSHRVNAFIETFMPQLWSAFAQFPNREDLLADHFRNGLVHEIFMKEDCGIHETLRGAKRYVIRVPSGWPSIDVDLIAGEFHEAIERYIARLRSDQKFRAIFQDPAKHALSLSLPMCRSSQAPQIVSGDPSSEVVGVDAILPPDTAKERSKELP